MVIVMVIVLVSVAAGRSVRAHPAFAPQCPDFQFSAARDPSNPLELPSAPGSNPLHGAHFFVDGPRHGAAAGAIAQLLGIDPTTYPDSYSWASFKQDISPGGSLYGKLVGNPQLAANVALLSQIADQQETENLSLYSQGGGTGATYSQVQKILCHSLTADPTPDTVPVFSTFFIYPNGQFCPALSALLANTETFKRQIDEVAAGTGTHPAVFLLEIDAVGTSTCLTRAELTVWESDLRYEIEQLTALPHAVVYVEGGAADEDSAAYVAKVLNEICVVKTHSAVTNFCAQLRGFYVNGTHFDWTIHEINWANQVVALLRKLTLKETGHAYIAHYVVNTAQNGQGPKLNPHPVQQGIEDLCNPPGRGLGRTPTADTDPTFDGHAFPLTDAFLWTGVPGRSHNSNCHPGDASAGVFDLGFALELAANAGNQLGPSMAVAGASASATVVRGVVLIRNKTSGRFVPLKGSDVQVPMGAMIDARKGAVVLATAADYRSALDPLHRVQTGTFSAAMFLIKQLTERQALARQQTGIPATDLVLTNPPGAASKARCRRRGPPGKGVVRSLNGVAKGVYRTIGGASTTTVTNASWTVQDRCDGTLTKVRKGRATVTPKAHPAREVILSAGQELLVRARLLQAKV
jgi:endoglucanase